MQSIQRASNSEMVEMLVKFYQPFTKKRQTVRILDTTYGHGTFWSWWRPIPKFSHRGFLDGVMEEMAVLTLTGEQVSGGRYERITMDKRNGLGANVVGDHNDLEKFFKRGEDYFDVIFYDPPYGGVKDTEIWRSMPRYNDRQMNADEACLISDDGGALNASLASKFNKFLPVDGVVIYKNTHFKKIPRPLYMYDYVIQELGPLSKIDRFKHPKARPCHAFWMILRQYLTGKEENIIDL